MSAIARIITWEEIYALVETLPPGVCYGVPRGGAVVAGLTGRATLSPVYADFIVDDLIDSGRTKREWGRRFPDKPFVALFTKNDPGVWLVFPWEGEDPSDDYENLALRLLQHAGRKQSKERIQEVICHLKYYVERQLV